jgi:hypothetical protein
LISTGTSESYLAIAEGKIVDTDIPGDASAVLMKEHGVNVNVQQGP